MATKQEILAFISIKGHSPSGYEQAFLERYEETKEVANDYEKEVLANFNALFAPVVPVVEEVVVDVAPDKAAKSK